MEKSVRDHCYAAVDIGASSGRVIVGTVTDGVIGLKEVYRFDNGQQRLGGHDCWNVESLFQNVVTGLAAAKEQGYEPTSIGIDTWAVDFVLLDEKGEMVGDAVAYRDARTDGMYETADALMSPERHYALTGIQRQPFNTIYQLLALKREHPEQLERATRLLMIPDYLNWRLTGKGDADKKLDASRRPERRFACTAGRTSSCSCSAGTTA